MVCLGGGENPDGPGLARLFQLGKGLFGKENFMAFIDWSGELELGYKVIDHQHRWMVETANQLYDEIMSPEPDRSRAEVILGGLQFFIRHHFEEEERLLELSEYPDLAAHKEEHRRVELAFSEWCREQGDGRTCSRESLPYLKNWLLIHIRESDRRFIGHLGERGLLPVTKS
jgi:hemerythrin